ncbi:MAG TPA: hypothetical protein VGH79_06835 [Gaiellaceae bacterium]|jgi:hypothetical protein
MRAFAGNTSTKVVTKNVTKFCVYVDRHNGGDSYGDVSVLPKYKNKTCIVGKRGPAGDSSVVSWNKTVANAPAPPSQKHGLSANYVDLAKVGPFTIRGYCALGEGVESYTDVISAQNGSSLAWDDESNYPASFQAGDDRRVSNSADGSSQSPSFVTEYENGEFAVASADQTTAFTGFAENGVYIQGADGPACSFTGYIVIEKSTA